MAKKPRKPSARGRLLWARGGGYRLVDRAGDELRQLGGELTRQEVDEALSRDSSQVVVYKCTGPLRWYDGPEGLAVWRKEVGPDFHDVADWRPPRGAPGQLQFHALMWVNDATRGHVVMFTDFD